MSVGCSIIRDGQDIQYVESPYNGERSLLYDSALEYTENQETAIDIWATASTPSFKEEVYDTKLNTHRTSLYKKLNEIQPNQNKINLIYEGGQHEVYIDTLDYEVIETKTLTTLSAFTEINGKKVQIGKIRFKPFRDGFQVENSLLNKIQVYNKGKIESIAGKGVGTEIYKELIFNLVSQGQSLYSDASRTAQAEGIWNKFRSYGIATEIDNNILVIKHHPFDNNQEPYLRDVTDFIERRNTENNLSEQEKSDLKVSMLTTRFNDSEELYYALRKGFYPNGVFNPTNTSLSQTGIYNSAEIENILNDAELQQSIKDTINKIKNTEEVIDNDIPVDNNFISVSEYRLDILGKNIIDNPYINKKEVIQELGGIKDPQQYQDRLEDTNFEYIKSGDFFEQFSEYNRIPIYREEGESRTKELLEETIKLPENNNIQSNIRYLSTLSNSIWQSSPNEVRAILKQIRLDSQDIALDLQDLENLYNTSTRPELLNLLGSLDSFLTNQSEDTLNNFIEVYDTFYNIETPVEVVEKVSPEHRDGNLFYIENVTKTAYKLFVEQGFLPIGQNTYRKVRNSDDLSLMYDNIYENIKVNPQILPNSAYSSAQQPNGQLDRSRINRNREETIRDIKSFVQQEVKKIDIGETAGDIDMLERMYLSSAYFNTNLNNLETIPSIESQASLINNPIGNQQYLTSEYIADFRVRQIKEKHKNSQQYQDFYSNFEVTKNGIEIINADPISIEKMRSYLQDNENLVNHLRLNKQGSELLERSEQEVFIDNNIKRNFYLNYPKSLPIFTGIYQTLSNRSIAAKTKEPFIRVNNKLYEMVKEIGSYGFYSEIDTNPSNYKVYYSTISQPELDINIENYKYLTGQQDLDIEITTLYNQNQEENIDNEIECK